MFDKFSKYLIVNAKNITKTIYRSERIFTANDGYNRYAKDGAINITEIFEKNNVPKEFQIVIINLNELYGTPHLFPQIKKAKEFFTDKPLELHIKTNDDGIYIEGISNPTGDPMDTYCAPQNELKTIPIYASYKTVLAFIKELKKNGYYEAYRKSIIEALGLDVRIINHNKKLSKLVKNLSI